MVFSQPKALAWAGDGFTQLVEVIQGVNSVVWSQGTKNVRLIINNTTIQLLTKARCPGPKGKVLSSRSSRRSAPSGACRIDATHVGCLLLVQTPGLDQPRMSGGYKQV